MGLLEAFVEREGHCRVPQKYAVDGFNLGTWCGSRRGERKAGTLSAERLVALDALGFVWDAFQDAFERGLEELAAYVQAYGDARVPTEYSTPGGFRLGNWCNSQRDNRRQGIVSVGRIAALDALGFAWAVLRDDFDRGLAELATYVQEHGDARVPQSYRAPTGFKLGNWCAVRRKQRGANKLTVERVAALDALGFPWDLFQEDFDRGLAELAGYVRAHGDALVPARHLTSSGFTLGHWCSNRRKERKTGRLDAERIAALDRLGFVWDPHQEEFDLGLQALAAYVQTHGDARVPVKHITSRGFTLGSWCSVRRRERKNHRLEAERMAALDALGFVWDPLRDSFDRGLSELAAYVKAHGDRGFKLGTWCGSRRTERNEGALSAERIVALDALGLAPLVLAPSVGAVGAPFDNAMVEAFWARMRPTGGVRCTRGTLPSSTRPHRGTREAGRVARKPAGPLQTGQTPTRPREAAGSPPRLDLVAATRSAGESAVPTRGRLSSCTEIGFGYFGARGRQAHRT